MNHAMFTRRAAAAVLALALIAAVPAAVRAEEPSAPAPSSSEPAAVPAPAVLISRSEMQPIPAGQETDVTFSFHNLGTTALTTPVAAVTPSEGLSVSGTSSSFALSDIPAGETGTVTVRLRAGDGAAASQSVGIELRYSYDANGAPAQGTSSDRLSIPVTPKPAAVQPLIAVTRSGVSSPISPGEEFVITLTFENKGQVTVTGAAATVTPSEALNILNETSTFPLPDIAPGKSASATVKLRAAKEIASESQSLMAELRFVYDNAGTPTAASATEKVNIPARATAASSSAQQKTDAPVPNIVVKSFTYGDGKTVAAGAKFPLSFTFENTGSLTCENIVVIVDGGESFTVDGGTNTAHYKSLGAGKEQKQELNMQALPAAKSGAQSISVSFKYEYVDGTRRAAVTSDVRISVPVSQPDRFQITAPAQGTSASAGEETEVTLAYVNKGKGDVANLEAELVGEGFTAPTRTQYLGNVAAGGSGNIGFAVTPDDEGTLKFTVKVTYEDADQQVQTREFPVTLEVQAPVLPDDDFAGMDEPEKTGAPAWLWACLAALAAAAAAVGVILWRRKKQAARTEAPRDWGWDDGGDGEE